MLRWGITLMAVGGLSFVLPLFGRQFIIVSALGLTGMGSGLAGIGLFVVGLMLFNSARKKESQEFEHRHATKGASREPAIADSAVRKHGAENSSNYEAAAIRSSNTHHVFRFADGEALSPHLYGIKSIKFSLEGSEKAIEEIIGSKESKVQQEISAKRGPVQLHLLALQAAVFYVCADQLSSSKRDVLTDVAGGIAEGFTAVMGEYGSAIYDLFQDYAYSLAKELKENGNDNPNPFDMGATANLVANNISGQCDINKLLADNQLEKLRIEEIASRSGIKLLVMRLLDGGITYTERAVR